MKHLIALVIFALIATTPALGQVKKPVTAAVAPAVPCVDLLNKLPIGCTPRADGIGSSGSKTNPLEALIEMIVNTDDAIALATAIPAVQDPVGGSCWKSFAGISAVVKAHPNLLTGKAAADLEALRLVHISLNQVCANPNCGQMWNDLNNSVASLQPAPLPLSLTSLCAKIPVIGTAAAPSAPPVVAPVTPATPPNP